MRLLIIAAAIGGAALALASCETMSAEQCMAGDWSGQGYADGQSGLTMSRLDDHAEACAKHGVTPDAAAYAAGRRQGLVYYCTPAKGFEVGRTGSGYAGVCPAELEADFTYAYRDGQIVHAPAGVGQRLFGRVHDLAVAVSVGDVRLQFGGADARIA